MYDSMVKTRITFSLKLVWLAHVCGGLLFCSLCRFLLVQAKDDRVPCPKSPGLQLAAGFTEYQTGPLTLFALEYPQNEGMVSFSGHLKV